MSLDLLAEAFSHLGGTPEVVPGSEVAGSGQDAPGNVESAEAPGSADPLAVTSAGTEPVESRSGARGRRGRRNRSASRAQGAANETNVEHHDVRAATGGGTSHEAKAPAEPAKKPTAASEPIILGVGVPASEL